MTEHELPVLYRRTEAKGKPFGGIPNRDLTQEDWDALTPDLRRDVKHSPLFEAVQVGPPSPPATKEPGKQGGKSSEKGGDA